MLSLTIMFSLKRGRYNKRKIATFTDKEGCFISYIFLFVVEKVGALTPMSDVARPDSKTNTARHGHQHLANDLESRSPSSGWRKSEAKDIAAEKNRPIEENKW